MKLKQQTKVIDFEAVEVGKVTLTKLSLKAVREMQNMAKDLEDATSFDSNIEAIRFVIRAGVVEAAELSNEDFDLFSLGDLAALQQKVMEYSGLAAVDVPESGNV
jgi:hypothetical protein